MRKEKTVLIITHDLELIAGACDRCIGLSDGHAEAEFPVHSERDLQAVRQYMERFHPSDAPAKKQHKERFHPATKLLYWLVLLVVISTSNNHLVYAAYAALILLTAADGWLGTALAGGMSFGLLWVGKRSAARHGVFLYVSAVPAYHCRWHFHADDDWTK